MEVWASGFNAWNQLQFEGELQDEPRDLSQFTCVLKEQQVEILRTTLSATVVRTTSGLRIAGFPDEFTKLCSDRDDALTKVAIAGNDKTIEFNSEGITQYDSLQAFLAKDSFSFESLLNIRHLAANQTVFTALSSNGTVYTWGDSRYEACLGREVTDETPASKPCIVEELSDLPDRIAKISSGGYVTAALTSGNDVYIWGRQGHPELSPALTVSPTPVDLDGQDFLDVAVGVSHLILLTTEHRIFVLGAGGNGQLGLRLGVKELKDWKEVILPLREGQHVVGVHAGYKNSFVIVRDIA